jgi:hypothetical protein
MTGPVVEFARRWLGVTELEGRLRLQAAELRRVELALDQLQRNVAAAEKVAKRAAIGGESDGLLKVLSILKRGR